MKNLLLVALIALAFAGCGGLRTHKATGEKGRPIKNFEFCGGEIWGSLIDPGAQSKNPKRPRVALFFHLHPNISKNAEKAVGLYLVVRSQEDIVFSSSKPELVVNIDGKKSTYNVQFQAQHSPMQIYEKYPSTKYDIEPNNLKKREYKVAKKNPWLLNTVSGEPEIVKIPEPLFYEVDEKNVNLELDPLRYKTLYLQFYQDIWTNQGDLRNAKISVRLPAYNLNDWNMKEQEIHYELNYDQAKKNSKLKNRRRCPSTEEIFLYSI